MYRAIQLVDFSVVYGFRGEEDQNRAWKAGHSTKPWPKSKHNQQPSIAIDILPYPSGWPQDNDPDNVKKHKIGHFYYMAGVVMQCAKDEGIELRWGGDWDMDKDFMDQSFAGPQTLQEIRTSH